MQPPSETASEWVRFTHSLWHSRWLIVACVIVSMVLATAYNYTARPRYEAVAQIEIRKTRPDLTPGNDVVEAVTPEWIETQYRMLVGKSLITKVVERYDFTSSPELGAGPMRSPIELIRTKLFGRATEDFGPGIPVAPAVAAFRSRVTVRPIPRTSLVDLVFRAYDPRFAAMAANGLAQTYVDESRSDRSDQSTEATKWLEARLQAEQEQARSSFEALRSYEERSGSSNLEARQRLVEAKLQQASAQLLQARSEKASKKAYLDQLRGMSASELLTLPELAASQSFQAMRKDLVDTELRKAELDQSLGPKHPDVVGLQNRIQSIRAALTNEARGVVRAVEAAYEAASRQESVLAGSVAAAQAEMSALRDKSPEYQTLKRDADTSNEIAQALARRGKEASVESAVNDRTVRAYRTGRGPAGAGIPGPHREPADRVPRGPGHRRAARGRQGEARHHAQDARRHPRVAAGALPRIRARSEHGVGGRHEAQSERDPFAYVAALGVVPCDTDERDGHRHRGERPCASGDEHSPRGREVDHRLEPRRGDRADRGHRHPRGLRPAAPDRALEPQHPAKPGDARHPDQEQFLPRRRATGADSRVVGADLRRHSG